MHITLMFHNSLRQLTYTVTNGHFWGAEMCTSLALVCCADRIEDSIGFDGRIQ